MIPFMIPISQIPTSYQQLFNDITATVKEYNVRLKISEDDEIEYLGHPHFGFFIENPPTLGLAIGGDPNEWLPVLVHESCHMDQWIEQSPYWTNGHISNVEVCDIMNLWIDREIELSPTQITNILTKTRDIELDAERRTVDKFVKYGVDINVEEYVQRANAYIYSYNFFAKFRAWNDPDKLSAHLLDSIWTKMPTHFNNDYTETPCEYREYFAEIFPQMKCKGCDCEDITIDGSHGYAI